jgi:hypothetical protein
MPTEPDPIPRFPESGDLVDPVHAASVGSEDLDEDRLGEDPFEEDAAPDSPDADIQRGVTEDERRAGETLDDRLRQEEPEVDE